MACEQLNAPKYGLPEKVVFCKRCVISNQRPSSCIEFQHNKNSSKETIGFDKEGICDACHFSEKKDKSIDWALREKELKDLLNRFRSNDGRYDVLVPGSGGKDSVFASHILRKKYNMHPLTITWAPHIYTDIGWKNFQGWIHSGFDNLLFTPNGKVHRLLTKLAYENLLHPFQPFILGQKNLAPKYAALHNIQLVIFGENEAEYGNPIQDTHTPIRDEKYYMTGNFNNLYLGGVSVNEIQEKYDISTVELAPYLPASYDLMDKKEVQVHYLGYYLKWVPQEAYYYAVEHSGFEANPERTEGTYSKYNSIDDRTDGFHYWTTFIKFGIGRATYDAAQEIRNHHISREEGVALVHRFDGEFPKKYFKEFLEYISLDEERFFEIANNARSPHLWKKDGNEWKLKYKVS